MFSLKVGQNEDQNMRDGHIHTKIILRPRLIQVLEFVLHMMCENNNQLNLQIFKSKMSPTVALI